MTISEDDFQRIDAPIPASWYEVRKVTKYIIEPGDWECATGECVDNDVVVCKVDQEEIIGSVEDAANKMAALTDEERIKVMQCFCRECGCVQPEGRNCQCWNDE